MHASLAVAAAHARYLRDPPTAHTIRPLAEIYHSSKCTTLLNRKLSSPIQPQDRDALWATAAYLAIVSFASLDATTPYEAWPLKSIDDPSDLLWLRMSLSKAVIWTLTDPSRESSIFRPMAPVYEQIHAPLPPMGIERVPPVLQILCDIDSASTAENNPYYTAVQALSFLAEVKAENGSPFCSLAFMAHIREDFAVLLMQKDPVALLLLSLWYAAASHAAWWIESRAEVEGRAICLYLERYHWDNGPLLGLLPWKSVRHYEDAFTPEGFYDSGHVEVLEGSNIWWTPPPFTR